MVDTRHIGAFIQDTVKPIIESLDELLGKCVHLKLSRRELNKMIDLFVEVELIKTFAYCITYLLITIGLCLTVYFILR